VQFTGTNQDRIEAMLGCPVDVVMLEGVRMLSIPAHIWNAPLAVGMWLARDEYGNIHTHTSEEFRALFEPTRTTDRDHIARLTTIIAVLLEYTARTTKIDHLVQDNLRRDLRDIWDDVSRH
jgi:hypothetical protein